MAEKLGLIGIPTSMGTFAPGQKKSPGALRDADLLGRLSDADVEVVDHGDSGGVRRWRPDKGNSGRGGCRRPGERRGARPCRDRG